eukprot:254647_1
MLKESIELPGGHQQHSYYTLDPNGYIIQQSDANHVAFAISFSALKTKLIGQLSSVLLPIGYPSTVTPEYMQFQLYDTIQELCGYLKGIIMNQASLTGLGVGDSSVKISNVLLTWTIKDLITMVLGLYISTLGSKIYGANMKIFWFTSSLVSALCGFVTLLAAIYTQHYGLLFIVSSILSTIGNVPGSIAKAGLAHHLAKVRNYSDVAAKEGNQSRCSKIIMIYAAYKYIEYMADNIILAWISYVILVAIQLFCIYKSIQTLILKDVNHSRMELILNAWFVEKSADHMTPQYVANRESMSVLNVLHFFVADNKWNLYFGHSLTDLDENIDIQWYMNTFKDCNFMTVMNNKQQNIMVFLNKKASARERILAYYVGYNIRWKIQKLKHRLYESLINECITDCKENGDAFINAMIESGWDVNDVKFCNQGWICQWT